MSNLCGCSRPVRAGYALCDTCRASLEQHLAEMRWLEGQLDISLTRVKGVDYTRSSPGRSAEKPLPWNERAAIAKANLKSELVGWVRIMHTAGGLPSDRIPDLAAWLLKRLEPITKRDDAWVIFETVDNACFEARAIVFAKPEEKDFIGPCEGRIIDDGDDEPYEVECHGEIFIGRDSGQAECQLCRRAYDTEAVAGVITRRNQKIADEMGALRTANEIGLMTAKEFGKSSETIRSQINRWHDKDRIAVHGHDAATEAPLFHMQEVHDMLVWRYRDTA